MDTERTSSKFHWSKIPAVKFQYKPSIQMLRDGEEIEVNNSRRKSDDDHAIIAIFDSTYVIEACSRFFNNLLVSNISREEWDTLCKNIWLNFYSEEPDLDVPPLNSKLSPTTATKSKGK